MATLWISQMNTFYFCLRLELKKLLKLGLPIVLTQFIQVSNATVAVVMMGRVGPLELAAVGLGGTLTLIVFLAALGVMMSISPTISHHFGSGKPDDIVKTFHQGIWLALITGIFSFILLKQIHILMYWINVDAAVIPITKSYLNITAWSMPAACFYFAFRFLCESTGTSKPMLIVNIVTLPIVFIGNWVLIFGFLGFPAMGVSGAAINVILVMAMNTIGMVLFLTVSEKYSLRQLFFRLSMPSKQIVDLLRLGLPIACTLILDSAFFSAIALLMGKIGHVWLAAHQVAINFATIVFMIPVSIASATMARVGKAIGQNNYELARLRGFLGIGISLFLVLPFSALVFLFPELVALIYTDSTEVISASIALLMIASLLPIFDSIYISAQGALRGIQDVKIPLLICISTFWIFGLSFSWYLGITADYGAVGLWWGMVVGVMLTGVFLTIRFYLRTTDI